MARASPVLRRTIEKTTADEAAPNKTSGVRLDDGMCSLRACNNRVTGTRRNALRPSQLLTLAIDRFGTHMAIVAA